MIISIGSDHAGFLYKEALKHMLEDAGHTVMDVGPDTDDRVDYPDYGVAAAQLVANGQAERGVVVCGSGIGISIAANKVHGIRCANVTSVEMAQLARAHNDANMIALGERLTPIDVAKNIVQAFLDTPFEGGRHAQRVDKLNQLGGRS
jgi:ribose 5-phosphate isomerase B